MAVDYVPVKEVPIEMNIDHKNFSVFCFSYNDKAINK